MRIKSRVGKAGKGYRVKENIHAESPMFGEANSGTDFEPEAEPSQRSFRSLEVLRSEYRQRREGGPVAIGSCVGAGGDAGVQEAPDTAAGASATNPGSRRRGAAPEGSARDCPPVCGERRVRGSASPPPGGSPEPSATANRSIATVQPGQVEHGRRRKLCTGSLKKLFEGRGFGFIVPDGSTEEVFLHFSDLTNGGSRDLAVGVRLCYEDEVDACSGRLRAHHATIIGDSLPRGPQIAPPAPRATSHARIYGREKLLAIGRANLRAARARGDSSTGNAGIRSVHMPWVFDADAKAPGDDSGDSFSGDPCLDDETLLARLESRLSRESGADAKNLETFGECAAGGGWTFEEALKANAKIALEKLSPTHHNPAAAEGGEQQELVGVTMRMVYSAAALEPDKKLDSAEPPPQPGVGGLSAQSLPGKHPSGDDFGHCFSTVAGSGTSSSGHASPVSRSSARDFEEISVIADI